MSDIFSLTFLVGLLSATLRVATPLVYGAMGEIISERGGVLNLGIEGTMFLGAFTGFAAAAALSNAGVAGYLWLGLAAAILAGMIMGALMGLFAVTLGVNQHVSGLGITLLCTGLALFGFRLIFGESDVLPKVTPFAQIAPLGATSPAGVVLEQYLLTYIAFLVVVPVSWWLIYRTRFGLNLRAVGENPEAADASGVSVARTRYASLILGGALMAVGGAFLSLAQLGAFTPGIVAGRGWVCIALVIFARWHPVRGMWGALLFGGVFALQLRLQTLGLELPYELFLALPYLVTILALALAGRNVAYPGAYLKPYHRE
ncbi:MAG: ABC transporter permease [Caldilineaceae bacterium]|nr:ABC transporter permease [Caldilineaceae bacterium]